MLSFTTEKQNEFLYWEFVQNMWPNLQDLVTFTEEIFNEILHFWYSDFWFVYPNFWYRDNYFENLLRSDWFDKISIISLFLKVRRNDLARKFSIRRNNNNGISIKTGCIVIAHLLTCSDQEKCMYTTIFELITMIKLYLHFFIYKYNFSCSLFRTTHKLINDRKII